jgi:Flp pilus assembly protein TadD
VLGNSALASAEEAVDEGRWERAAVDAARAERFMPWSSRPWLLLGAAQLGAGDPRRARASFTKAVTVDDADWRAWSELAVVSSGGAKARAIRRARALNPLEPSVQELQAAPQEGG